MDWFRWHDNYTGQLSERLERVQSQIDAALALRPPGPIRIISVCAGQAHDIVGSLRHFDRRADVRALLVELDERNVAAARKRIADAELPGVEVLAADAGITTSYATHVPADLILLCGVFGSLTDPDIDRTISTVPTLAAPGAQVIWTAHRSTPGLRDQAVRCFDRYGFAERWSGGPADHFGVGRHQLLKEPEPYRSNLRMFSFADEQTLISLGRVKK